VQQIKRYEAGSFQSTAEALKKLALVLHVTTDFLLFEEGEREPDDDLTLRFEAVATMPDAESDLEKIFPAAQPALQVRIDDGIVAVQELLRQIARLFHQPLIGCQVGKA